MISYESQRGLGLSSSFQVLLALRLYATWGFQDVIGELVGVTQVTVILFFTVCKSSGLRHYGVSLTILICASWPGCLPHPATLVLNPAPPPGPGGPAYPCSASTPVFASTGRSCPRLRQYTHFIARILSFTAERDLATHLELGGHRGALEPEIDLARTWDRTSDLLFDQSAGGGAGMYDRRVPADLRADSLSTVSPTPPGWWRT
ncbi:hypothetical protein PoB_003183200 [Plakobranchus ocellatus]|uniref:Uncharacterized protein n=1 Tax=Plakobranchus ocellatus TaxID=259542 RepID=A0AAV4AE98_9GAST|nr:hypothetical protein PoB_003183200 [Plakobranchus ocellatus]